MAKTFASEWRLEFDAAPEVLWPLLADTERLNEAAKIPRVEMEEYVDDEGKLCRIGRARAAGITFEWVDEPYEWVTNRWFRHNVRVFNKGPVAELIPELELVPGANGGSVATYRLAGAPRGALGELLFRTGYLQRMGRAYAKVAANAEAFLAGTRETAFNTGKGELTSDARARVAAIVAELADSPYDPGGLAGRLGDYVLGAESTEVDRLRSRTLARRWGVDPRAMTELCLVAVKTGLLAMSWDVLCPRCRGAKAAAGSLDQLPTGVHCPSCNISYDREFAHNVELTFRPNPAIRAVGDGAYCLSGPMTTPHVIVQLVLEAGERREVAATLQPGAYRLRTLEPGGESDIEFAGGGFPALVFDGATVAPGPPAPPDTLVMENRSARKAVLLIEDRTWIADALTAHEATTLQAFRDMFSDEVLRPGDDVSVGHVSLLFTDIKGSTAYYEAVGDAHAYHVVRDHFAYLGEAVRRHDGAIIKTIGDAVMAAFARPADAVAAALDVQRNIAAFNRDEGGEHVILKIGLHAGACIAVNLNGRLDYFGSTVNMAARLQGESVGDDIVLSEALAGDAGVTGLIADCEVARESASLKGFEQPVSFVRVTARAFGGG